MQSWTKKRRKGIGKSDFYPISCKRTNDICLWFTRGFKALKQSTKLLFLELHRPDEALKTYTELLAYTKSAVTRNYSEKTINGILDYVGGGKGGPVEVDTLERFYQVTKDALLEAKNEVNPTSLIIPYSQTSLSSDSPSKRISNWRNFGWTGVSISA